MPDLIRVLSGRVGRPILDRTGFAGQFSFILMFNPPDVKGDAWADRPNVFTAVEKQLGLKLEEAKIPAEHWAIERIEKPSEN